MIKRISYANRKAFFIRECLWPGVLCLFLCCSFAVSAEDSATAGPILKEAIEVVLSPFEAIAKPGEGVQFRLDAIYEDGSTAYIKAIHYSGYMPGRFAVTGEYGGKTDTATVLVLPQTGMSRIYLDPTEQNARSGDLVTFALFAGYENESAVHIKDVFFIAGGDSGRQNVSYTFLEQTAEASIVLLPLVEVKRISLKPLQQKVKPGETVSFDLYAEYTDGSTTLVEAVEFKAGDLPGTHTVTHKHEGRTAFATIIIEEETKKLIGMFLLPARQTIKIEETAEFELIGRYSDGTMNKVKAVRFTGEKAGTFPVTEQLQGKTATATVIVEKIEPPEEEDPRFIPAGGETLPIEDAEAGDRGFSSAGGTTLLVEENN